MNFHQNTSLYLGDLSPDVSENELYEKFSSIGPILSLQFSRDKLTNSFLGHGIVTFSKHDDAQRALETLNFNLIKNHPMRLMWFNPDQFIHRSDGGNIFIKNLDNSIDSKTLNDMFLQFGNILSSKIAYDENGNSKGYGFVQFEDEKSAQKAIDTINRKLLYGKIVYVGKFIPSSERKDESNKIEKSKKSTVILFVKNLGKDINDNKLQKMFEPYGKILSHKIICNDNGESKGFGFVAFETIEEGDAAIKELHGKKIDDNKPLYVVYAREKRKCIKYSKSQLKEFNKETNEIDIIDLNLKQLKNNNDNKNSQKRKKTIMKIRK